MNYLILNKSTGDKLRGRIDKGNYCDPILMKDGNYSLPESVLKEFPNHFKKSKVKTINHTKRKLTKADFPIPIDDINTN